MAAAGGIASAFISLAERPYRFNPVGTNAADIGSVDISGSWVADGSSSVTILWDGNDPSITKSTTGSTTVSALQVGRDNAEAGGRISNIEHTEVTLSEGDTIIYTSITISFETDDLP